MNQEHEWTMQNLGFRNNSRSFHNPWPWPYDDRSLIRYWRLEHWLRTGLKAKTFTITISHCLPPALYNPHPIHLTNCQMTILQVTLWTEVYCALCMYCATSTVFGLGTNKFIGALASALLSFWDFESSLKVKSTNLMHFVSPNLFFAQMWSPTKNPWPTMCIISTIVFSSVLPLSQKTV